jgi:hypothetical protein
MYSRRFTGLEATSLLLDWAQRSKKDLRETGGCFVHFFWTIIKSRIQNQFQKVKKHFILTSFSFIFDLQTRFVHAYSYTFFTCHIWNMREVLVSCREKWNFFVADFHVLGLFLAKKHDLSKKKFFRMSRAGAVAVAVERKICATPTAYTIRPRKLKFWLSASIRATWCPAYSEFRNSGS